MLSSEPSIGLDLTSGHRIVNLTNPMNYQHIIWNSKFLINGDDDVDDDTFNSPLPFDASDGGLWNGRFVPPPPRPPFLDDAIISDGLTTCDLCTWALPEKNAYSIENTIEAAGELGWVFMITIVAVLSALIGAILMIVIYKCNRSKSANGHAGPSLPWWCRPADMNAMRNSRNLPKQRPAESLPIAVASATPINGGPPITLATATFINNINPAILSAATTTSTGTTMTPTIPTSISNGTPPTSTTATNPQVWIWLKDVNTPISNDIITFPQSSSIENYYTNNDDNISSPSKVSEVVYEEISGIG